MRNVNSNKRTIDTIAMFHFDGRGKCSFHNSESITSTLGKDKMLFLQNSLNQTLKVIKEDSPDLCNVLSGRKIHLRISDAFEGTVFLMPHDLAMNLRLLDFENRAKQDRECMLVGELEHALFHLCNPHFHISQVRIHSLHFYASHRDILKSTIRELDSHSHTFGVSEWLLTLSQIDNIVLLEKFWTWLGRRKIAKAILQVGSRDKTEVKDKDCNIWGCRCICRGKPYRPRASENDHYGF